MRRLRKMVRDNAERIWSTEQLKELLQHLGPPLWKSIVDALREVERDEDGVGDRAYRALHLVREIEGELKRLRSREGQRIRRAIEEKVSVAVVHMYSSCYWGSCI